MQALLQQTRAFSSGPICQRRAASQRRPVVRMASGGSCGSSPEGEVTSTGCGKGTCGSGGTGGTCSSKTTSLDALFNASGTMGMMSGSHVEISRHDIAMAFGTKTAAMANQGSGERVLSIDDVLAACPDDLVWEEFDEENN